MPGSRLKALNTLHLAACRMRVEGRNNAYIAEELGVQVRTLHVWFSDPLVKAEIKRLIGRIDDVFVERKATAGLRALDELSDFASADATLVRTTATCVVCGYVGSACNPHGSADPKCDGPWHVVEERYIGQQTKLDALAMVLDRVDDTTTLRDRAKAQEALNSGSGSGDGATNYYQLFAQMPDDKVAEILRAWNQTGAIPTTASD